MDLGAYVNIDELQKIANKNNISVPRLRGYRLMANAEKWHLEDLTDNLEHYCAVELCTSDPFWDPKANCFEFGWRTKRIENFYCPNETVRWNRIHGWKRRVLKTYIHNEKNNYKKQIGTFNKYVGCKDILMIHARIGGRNWLSYYEKIVNQPWFIEKVDDAFDSTYCDIYAKIDPVQEEA